MSKLAGAAKAYAEAHAWARKCTQALKAAEATACGASDGRVEDAENRLREIRCVRADACRKTYAAEVALLRVARGEE